MLSDGSLKLSPDVLLAILFEVILRSLIKRMNMKEAIICAADSDLGPYHYSDGKNSWDIRKLMAGLTDTQELGSIIQVFKLQHISEGRGTNTCNLLS